MPYNRDSLSDVRDRVGSDLDLHTGNNNSSQRGTLEAALKNAVAGVSHSLRGYIEYVGKQQFTEDADDESVIKEAFEYGLSLNDAKAAKGPLSLVGVDGTVVPAGREWFLGDVFYTSDVEVTISGGVAEVPVTAVLADGETLGDRTNQAAGAVLQLVQPLSGLDSSAAAAGGLAGGADKETVNQLRVRLSERKKSPPKGGHEDDYVAWAKQGHQHITRVWVYRHKDVSGNTSYGSILLFIVTDGQASTIPAQEVLDAAAAEIALYRPAGTKNVYSQAPLAKSLDLVFTSLTPNNQSVKDAIVAELKDLLVREAAPGAAIKLSHIREAISRAAGEDDFEIALNADFSVAWNEFAVLGDPTWPGA